MNKKIYFAGSIRGGRNDVGLYHEIISFIQQTDTVLTEMVGNAKHSVVEQEKKKEAAIYNQDTSWLRECDIVIAECTTPSLGVGYELAYAEAHQKPVHIIYRPKDSHLSAMLTGNPYFVIHRYENNEELFSILKNILEIG